MQATFKPTNYRFTLDDKYFVQFLMRDGEQHFVAAFAGFSDALAFVEVSQQRSSLNAAYIFTREQQVHAWHRPTEQRLAA